MQGTSDNYGPKQKHYGRVPSELAFETGSERSVKKGEGGGGREGKGSHRFELKRRENNVRARPARRIRSRRAELRGKTSCERDANGEGGW